MTISLASNTLAAGAGLGRAVLIEVDYDEKEAVFNVDFMFPNETAWGIYNDSTCYLAIIEHEDYEELVDYIDDLIMDILYSPDPLDVLLDEVDDEVDYEDAEVEDEELSSLGVTFSLVIFDFGEKTLEEERNYAMIGVWINNTGDLFNLDSFVIGADEINELVEEDEVEVIKKEKITEYVNALEDFMMQFGWWVMLIALGLSVSVVFYIGKKYY